MGGSCGRADGLTVDLPSLVMMPDLAHLQMGDLMVVMFGVIQNRHQELVDSIPPSIIQRVIYYSLVEGKKHRIFLLKKLASTFRRHNFLVTENN